MSLSTVDAFKNAQPTNAGQPPTSPANGKERWKAQKRKSGLQ